MKNAPLAGILMTMSLQRLAVVALVMFVAGGCASVLDQQGAAVAVPYRVSDTGHIVVEVGIDGTGPYDFAIDTAASISVVFDERIEQLDAHSAMEGHVGVHGMVASGRFPALRIDRLELNGEVWTDARMAVLPSDSPASSGIDGILGVDILRRYAVGFSTEDQVLRLFPPQLVSARSYRGWVTVPLRTMRIGKAKASFLVFDMVINNVEIPSILDLGASINLFNWRAANMLDVRAPRADKDKTLSGAIEGTAITGLVMVEILTIGNLRWRNEEFVVADTGLFDLLGLGDRPRAIVGSGLFLSRDFIIDFDRNRLLIKADMH